MAHIRLNIERNDFYLHVTQHDNGVTIHGPNHPRGKVFLSSEDNFEQNVATAIATEKQAIESAINSIQQQLQNQFDAQEPSLDSELTGILNELTDA